MIAIASNGHLKTKEFVQKFRLSTMDILLFDTDTTTYAEKFRDEGNLITRFDFNTKFAYRTV